MGKEANYEVKNIYQGSYSSFSPSYGAGISSYHVGAGSLGLTTDPRTANIIADASTKFSSGVKHTELALVSPEIFDSVPKQHLKEVNQLAKLIGAEVSIHAPVMDASGISQQGYSEANRRASEIKMSEIIERSHELNPDGNVKVNFHSAEGVPGTEWSKLPDAKKDFQGEANRIIAVDKESGRLIPLEKDTKYYPDGKTGGIMIKTHTPEENLNNQNVVSWDNSINQIIFTKERADELLRKNEFQIRHLLNDLNEAKKMGKEEEILGKLDPIQRTAYMDLGTINSYLAEVHKNANNLFSKAYEYGTDEQKKKLLEVSKNYKKELDENKGNLLGESQAMRKLLFELKDEELAPNQFVPVDKFVIEKSSQTFGNSAFNAYKKFGDKTPIMLIENPPAGFAVSTGEDLKNLVQESRKQFAKKVVEEKGVSEREANKIAEKFIGATWDLGHINMLRKHGLSEEDVIKETEKIAPFVKHVHLSDNFGFEHTELPMGMGNVPMKEIMGKLGEKGFEAKKIIEAGNWWQHFRSSPIKESLEGMGASFYTSNIAPYWNQSIGLQQGYLGGYGMLLPQTNYDMFGAGFSRLPAELGGSVQTGGAGGRMGGGRE
jgi:sugar phosphate isomerase/epimerase